MSATLDLAKMLLQRPSITPEDCGCQDIIAQRLAALGFEITHYPFGNVRNLWAKWGSRSPTLCFAGHTDVVPIGNEQEWISPPFSPTVREGKLFARGAADMKSSIAAMVTACERLIHRHPHFQGSLAFLITSDEEGEARDGTQATLKQLAAIQQIPDWCLVGEASSTHKLGDTLKVGRRGSLTGHFKIFGKQGHIAYPHLAKNPIHIALAPLSAIANIVWDNGNEVFPPTSLQFANLHSGLGANNIIPGVLEGNFNLRFCPITTPETIKNKIEHLLAQSGIDFEITWTLSGKAFHTADNQLIQSIGNTIEKVLGYQPELSTSGGTSDGRFFAEYGTKVVELGPMNATIHQTNECIHVEELEQLSALYEAILIDLFAL